MAVSEDTTLSGKGSIVYDSPGVEQRLVRGSGITGPSIPVQLTENAMALRDGSLTYPIELPALQSNATASIAGIVIRKADGTLQLWDAASILGKKKLILDGGSFQLVDDLNTDLFINLCPAKCEDIEGIIGYKEVTITCPGLPDVQAIQLFKVALCEISQEEDPDL